MRGESNAGTHHPIPLAPDGTLSSAPHAGGAWGRTPAICQGISHARSARLRANGGISGPATAVAAISAKSLTREQFQALAPNAVIEINGERITKSAFQARNVKAVQEAAKHIQDAAPIERSALEKQAADLLAPPAKQFC